MHLIDLMYTIHELTVLSLTGKIKDLGVIPDLFTVYILCSRAPCFLQLMTNDLGVFIYILNDVKW